MRQMAVVGIGIGYAGKPVEDLELDALLSPLLSSDTPIELASYSALSLGLIYLGTSNADISTAMITALLERPVADLKHPACRFLCLGLGLLFLGREDEAANAIESVGGIAEDANLAKVRTIPSSSSSLCLPP